MTAFRSPEKERGEEKVAPKVITFGPSNVVALVESTVTVPDAKGPGGRPVTKQVVNTVPQTGSGVYFERTGKKNPDARYDEGMIAAYRKVMAVIGSAAADLGSSTHASGAMGVVNKKPRALEYLGARYTFEPGATFGAVLAIFAGIPLPASRATSAVTYIRKPPQQNVFPSGDIKFGTKDTPGPGHPGCKAFMAAMGFIGDYRLRARHTYAGNPDDRIFRDAAKQPISYAVEPVATEPDLFVKAIGQTGAATTAAVTAGYEPDDFDDDLGGLDEGFEFTDEAAEAASDL